MYKIELIENKEVTLTFEFDHINQVFETISKYKDTNCTLAISSPTSNITAYYENGKAVEFEVEDSRVGSISFKNKDDAIEYSNCIKILYDKNHIECFNESFEEELSVGSAFFMNVKTAEAAKALKYLSDLEDIETPYNSDGSNYPISLLGKFKWDDLTQTFIHIQSTINNLIEAYGKF